MHSREWRVFDLCRPCTEAMDLPIAVLVASSDHTWSNSKLLYGRVICLKSKSRVEQSKKLR